MKNKEKYAKEIIEIACSGGSIAVTKECMRIEPCGSTFCNKCLFYANNCKEKVREWAESEYIEKPVISKSDGAFLDYLKDYKYMARDDNGTLCVYVSTPIKRTARAIWVDDNNYKILRGLDIDFPMVKWSDAEPWLIDDLKKLEVVEEYEKCLK